MYEGNTRIIRRKKITHCGVLTKLDGEYLVISACKGLWDEADEVYDGVSSEVTCKLCQKILAKADSTGKVKL